MSRRLLMLAVALSICACGSSAARPGSGSGTTSAAGSTSATPPCGPVHAPTLASSDSARVYAVNGDVVTCARGSSHHYKLGHTRLCINSARIAPVAVTGRLAAYGAQRCGVDTGSSDVVVQRLSDGKRLVDRPATTSPQPPESYVSVSAIVLARDGAVAWISVSGSIIRHTSTAEVHAFDRHGARLLDAGSDVGSKQLSLSGSTVRWRHGAAVRSARLS